MAVAFAVVFFIVSFIALGIRVENNMRGSREIKFIFGKRQLASLFSFTILIFGMFTFIPANNVGILYSPFSGVSELTMSEGLHSKGIFDKVFLISTEVQSKELVGISGQTQDAQYITMTIDVKYRVNSTQAFEVFRQYRTMESVSNSLIAPTVQRSVEAISTKYNVIDVLGEKRNELYIGIESELTERLKASGIAFVSINFTDTDAGEAIEQAIQDEAIAKKRVETAEQERQRVEIDSQQRVVEARANQEKARIEADTKVIESEAAAKIKSIEAKAEAEANRTISNSITPELLARMEAEARIRHGWVTITGSNGSIVTQAPVQ